MKEKPEQWKEIKDYPNYAVSTYGRVLNIKTGTMIWPSVNKQTGTLSLKLRKDGKSKRFTVARLVADAFIPNPNNSKYVQRWDKNPRNNHVENLKWHEKDVQK